MRLAPATVALTEADLQGPEPLAAALGVLVPDNWPPELYSRPALQATLMQLAERAEHGWSTWYLVGKAPEEGLLGVCGFKGRPDASGSVEIAYSVLDQYRNRGIASEAVQCLVEWAFGHAQVREVTAETLPHLVQSIGVLTRNGFSAAGRGSEYGVVRYVLPRSSLN
jgi:RimJ/RimL family protein N-acetyltransferase